jgi:carboxymethylenebutenolidase
MSYFSRFLLGCFWLLFPIILRGQISTVPASIPDTLRFDSGNLHLKGLLWKPAGKGPFPAVLFNHGSEASSLRYMGKLADVFTAQGYAFFAPFRRGQSLSRGQGSYILDQLDSATTAGGPDARVAVLIQLHEREQLADQLAGLACLKRQVGIDTNRIVVSGISFGGIQTMLMAAQPVGVRAAVNFAGAAMNWEKSEAIRKWLKDVVARAKVPIFFVQAENDFSTGPSRELSARMQQLRKPHRVRIYPPQGKEAMDGHSFAIRGTAEWAPDVFRFLEEYLK